MSNHKLIQQLNAILPQTQCRECSYASCRDYAVAMVEQRESIARCAPGGEDILTKLADLTEQDPEPYRAEVSKHYRAPATAIIVEEECIGCTKCIQACPVDAIIGSAKQLHTILTHECTGCGLCIEPCPVDCIQLKPLEQAQYQAAIAKQRYEARQQRAVTIETPSMPQSSDYVAAALARIAARKSS